MLPSAIRMTASATPAGRDDAAGGPAALPDPDHRGQAGREDHGRGPAAAAADGSGQRPEPAGHGERRWPRRRRGQRGRPRRQQGAPARGRRSADPGGVRPGSRLAGQHGHDEAAGQPADRARVAGADRLPGITGQLRGQARDEVQQQPPRPAEDLLRDGPDDQQESQVREGSRQAAVLHEKRREAPPPLAGQARGGAFQPGQDRVVGELRRRDGRRHREHACGQQRRPAQRGMPGQRGRPGQPARAQCRTLRRYR